MKRHLPTLAAFAIAATLYALTRDVSALMLGTGFSLAVLCRGK